LGGNLDDYGYGGHHLERVLKYNKRVVFIPTFFLKVASANEVSWNLVALEAVDAFDGRDKMQCCNGTVCKVKFEKMAFSTVPT
jgi:hypothetical protein